MEKLIPLLLILVSCGTDDLQLGQTTVDSTLNSTAAITTTPPSKNQWFKAIIIDVGQGAAALLIAPDGEAGLIDTGPPEIGAKAIAAVAEDQGVKTLDWILITHPHLDHNGSLEAVRATSLGAESRVIDHQTATVGETLTLGEARFKILAANGEVGGEMIAGTGDKKFDENAMSVALVLEYGGLRLLASGDLPGGGGNPPYDTLDLETPLAPLAGDVDILLVPHHGSHTSSNDFLLDAIKPEVGIISVGTDNEYFHPHPLLIRRLEEHHVEIRRTDQQGSICILANHQDYHLEPYSIDKCEPTP